MAKATKMPGTQHHRNSVSGDKPGRTIMVFERMKEMLAEQFDMDEGEITRDTDLMNDLGADSLDLVELIMALEEEYSVSATDESVYEHKTVGEISDYIETLVK